MNKKIILDLCGGTGSWSKPYKEAGYTVLKVSLPEFDILKTDYHQDRMTFRGNKLSGTIVLCKDVHGILAAPPCTEFSKAKTTKPRDFFQGLRTVEACMKIIWECLAGGELNLKWWALENPTGFLRRFLGQPTFTFMPWWFGDFTSKSTDLWGYFKAPKQKYFERNLFTQIRKHSEHAPWYSNPKAPPQYKHLKLKRSDIRAITPPCFAQAFFNANQ